MEKKFNYFVYEVKDYQLHFLGSFKSLFTAELLLSSLKDLFPDSQYVLLNS